MKQILLLLAFLISWVSTSSAQWYVQVAAFDRQVSVDYFKNLGKVSYQVDHNDIHRYYLGSYDSKAKAESEMANAKNLGYNAWVRNLEEVANSCSAICGAPAPPNELIKINSIFFGFDKYSLRPESKSQLEALAGILKENPSYRTVLRAHTDSKGNNEYNETLSRNRANAARDYLVSLGIPSSKIKTRTYGENSPIAKNALAGGSDTEQGRQLNRRVEIIVTDASGTVLNMVDEIQVPVNLSVN